MKRKSFADMDCAVALALEQVGEWWSLLIIRDALQGSTRFEQFRDSLDISPTVLSKRLTYLISAGLMERYRDSADAGRDSYRVTAKGRDLSPVLIALFAWGRRYVKGHRWGIDFVDRETGEAVDPVLIDRNTGKEVNRNDHAFVPGRYPSEATLKRLKPLER
ncbi:helix-turn-helix domain-containing protein [Paraburkholderia tropica]|uniref:HxlR family transcriptional regulator n=1 Tax=Paraburkholderia tropica TaxID=92647 RepID=A0ABX5MF28_9BURK|nr:helix-turn-helix domain-containing protein [Paraburkholderia tropica]MBB3004721.1 DNA-binding HxlR family transcriptional regulator [Paraburkholderia tropica]PXX05279.1 HxlR family transcriptional regulator [Paraburkholderia tropica]PZW70598.1 HxlR family transcriptional regulator [Paraburkholderia tropica]QNB17411.1 helix-turn-helix transcriptional regulator [Paraburkholderia tropica]